MDFELVKLEIDGEIATLTFNDPDNLNAMNQTMLDSLDLALDHVEDPENNIRCLILTGEGRGFCAGANMVNDLSDENGAGGNTRSKNKLPDAGAGLETAIIRFCGDCETCTAPLSQQLTAMRRHRHEFCADGRICRKIGIFPASFRALVWCPMAAQLSSATSCGHGARQRTHDNGRTPKR